MSSLHTETVSRVFEVFFKHHVPFLGCTLAGRKEEEYRHALGSFGVSSDLALRPILSLSGGQKSRLAFSLMAMTRWERSCWKDSVCAARVRVCGCCGGRESVYVHV